MILDLILITLQKRWKKLPLTHHLFLNEPFRKQWRIRPCSQPHDIVCTLFLIIQIHLTHCFCNSLYSYLVIQSGTDSFSIIHVFSPIRYTSNLLLLNILQYYYSLHFLHLEPAGNTLFILRDNFFSHIHTNHPSRSKFSTLFLVPPCTTFHNKQF